MYNFRPCTYEELHKIIKLYGFSCCPWEIILSDYMDGLEIIETTDGTVIALIYYDPERNDNCEMLIMEFEVREDMRRMGHGRQIIRQFLLEHPTSAELLPSGDVAVSFWKSCGFVGDQFGQCYYPED